MNLLTLEMSRIGSAQSKVCCIHDGCYNNIDAMVWEVLGKGFLLLLLATSLFMSPRLILGWYIQEHNAKS